MTVTGGGGVFTLTAKPTPSADLTFHVTVGQSHAYGVTTGTPDVDHFPPAAALHGVHVPGSGERLGRR